MFNNNLIYSCLWENKNLITSFILITSHTSCAVMVINMNCTSQHSPSMVTCYTEQAHVKEVFKL